MSFDLNVLVNGSRCKQYQHQGRTYIEAKNGSEYVLEIKNHHWKRVLAVCSVDGINVITGETASDKDTGYIIPAYSSEKIKGFRFSDDEWAMFRFGYKFNGKTYAQSKGGDAEKNCGVIGFRIFYEKEPTVQWSYTPAQWNSNTPTDELTCSYSIGSYYKIFTSESPPYAISPNTITCNCSDLNQEQLYSCNVDYHSTDPNPTQCVQSSKKRPLTIGHSTTPSPANFDMGTEWGRRETSRVHTVQFERGALARSFDIYYASRDALIAMGVPIHNVLFMPQAFPNTYAKPPKDWNG